MSEAVSIRRWAERWWHIFRSHQPSQLGWRALKLTQRRLFPLLSKRRYLDVTEERICPRNNRGFDAILQRHLELRLQQGDIEERVASLLRGEFRFLNLTRNLGAAADIGLSAVEPVSHLWRFHLQYQEYLLDLLAAVQQDSHSEAASRIPRIIDAWIDANPITRPGALDDAWHPFCLSRRIPVWLLVWHAGLVPEDLSERFAGCLEAQIRYLERHLEWDLRGNHVLENLRAVALAGAFGEGPAADQRLRIAERHFRAQLDEQLLPSGEHFERSPMYHSQMLAAVLDVRDAATGVAPSLSELCNHTAQRMSEFLDRILHPDGRIPLLADSALSETPSAQVLIRSAASRDSVVNPPARTDDTPPAPPATVIGDCWTWRDGSDYLIFDAGPVGAEQLPAHAHCDLLTIEVSVAGERLIVDSGVYDYERSPMRRYCRSTAAHNVLQVDHAEQCDLWSRFRMGQRGRPGTLVAGADRDFAWAAATHDGYRRLGVPLVGRGIACRRGGPWIIVDWAVGRGQRSLTHWLHLAPTAALKQVSERTVRLEQGDWSGTLSYLTEGTVSLEAGWYCRDFGVRQEAPVVRCDVTRDLPGFVVWMLSWEGTQGTASLQHERSTELTVIWNDDAGQFTWSPAALFD